MQLILTVFAFAFLGVTNAVLSITYPNSETTWYKNNTVSVNWTSTDPTTDTFFVRVLLSNSNQSLLSGNHSLADSINATSDFVTFLLPALTDGSGFIVTLVNTSNQDQIFATSDPFTIEDGITPNTTSTTSGSSSISMSLGSGNIPGAPTLTSSFSFASASPSTSASTKSSSASPVASFPALVVANMALGLSLGLAIMI